MSITGSGQLGIPGSSHIPVTESKFFANTSRASKEYKIGHRRVDEDGQVTYKKKPTSELMTAIQLGIGQSIGGLSPKPKRDVLYGDFDVVESIFFPREGSSSTPAHRCSDFRFKTYAPIAFRYFRDLFGIQPEDFLLSLCNEPLKELSNPGASGSIFYLSNDDEFIIKTVQKKEAEFLQKLLPGYYMNLNQNPRTLLPKFYGLYCYQCGGKNIRFIIMNNLLPSTIEMHSKFDLKGSSYKRKASSNELTKINPTYKDLDFLILYPDGLLLEPETHSAFIKTVERDCRVLQSFKIMDYSMLIGIHRFESQLPKETSTVEIDYKLKLNKARMAQFSTALESIHAEADTTHLDFMNASLGGIPALTPNGEKLFLYIGIIDILQSYRFAKKLEHTFKSFIADGDTISVHRPGFYAQRFQSFFALQVFKKITPSLKSIPSKKKSLTERQKIFAGEGLEYIDAYPSRDFLPDNSSPLPPYSTSKHRFKTLSNKDSSIDDIMINSPDFSCAKAKKYILKFDLNFSEKSCERPESNEEKCIIKSKDNVVTLKQQNNPIIS